MLHFALHRARNPALIWKENRKRCTKVFSPIWGLSVMTSEIFVHIYIYSYNFFKYLFGEKNKTKKTFEFEITCYMVQIKILIILSKLYPYTHDCARSITFMLISLCTSSWLIPKPPTPKLKPRNTVFHTVYLVVRSTLKLETSKSKKKKYFKVSYF